MTVLNFTELEFMSFSGGRCPLARCDGRSLMVAGILHPSGQARATLFALHTPSFQVRPNFPTDLNGGRVLALSAATRRAGQESIRYRF